MSIATVITGGFGSFGSISAVILEGYTPGAPVPVVSGDTHDLPRHLSEDYKKHLKKREQALEVKRLEKVEEARKLREDIDRARGIFPEDDESIATEQPVVTRREIRHDPLPDLLAQLAIAQHHLVLLAEQQKQLAMEARKKKDEEDIQVILHALSLH